MLRLGKTLQRFYIYTRNKKKEPMAESADRRGELRRRIQQLQSSLAAMEDAPAADPEPVPEVTLQSLSKQLTQAEHRIQSRFQSSERYLLQQFDDQTLASVMITGLMIATGLYVMYFLIENLMRLRRCRCPDISAGDLEVVLTAARMQIVDFGKRQEAAAQKHSDPAAAGPSAASTAPTTIVKTVVVDSCAA